MENRQKSDGNLVEEVQSAKMTPNFQKTLIPNTKIQKKSVILKKPAAIRGSHEKTGEKIATVLENQMNN